MNADGGAVPASGGESGVAFAHGTFGIGRQPLAEGFVMVQFTARRYDGARGLTSENSGIRAEGRAVRTRLSGLPLFRRSRDTGRIVSQ